LIFRSQTWFSQLEALILMSYEDAGMLPSMTIHSGLLRALLQSAHRKAWQKKKL
jgi:hypothetical protein